MNIVNFFVLDTELVAGCENGLLVFWELKRSIDEVFADIDGLKPELKRSECILKFSSSLKGLHSLGEKIIGFDTTFIYLTDITAIESAKLQNNLIKHVSIFFLSEVRITTLFPIDEEIILFGTEDNKICLYDLARQKIKKQTTVYKKLKEATNHKLFFTEPQKKVQVIDIVLASNKQSAFVALSNSHIYQVQVEALEIVKELRFFSEKLQSLMLNEKEDLIWCIYEHLIIGESLSEKTERQIIRIQASNTIGVAKIDEERYFVAGRHPQINWIFNYSENYMMKLTTRYTASFKFIALGANRYLLIGGSDGVIDVFWKNSHHLVLFPDLDSATD